MTTTIKRYTVKESWKDYSVTHPQAGARPMRRCATNPMNAEYSLCGDASDGHDSGDLDEPFEFAGPDQSITCPNCCRAIREVKAIRNRLRPRTETA